MCIVQTSHATEILIWEEAALAVAFASSPLLKKKLQVISYKK